MVAGTAPAIRISRLIKENGCSHSSVALTQRTVAPTTPYPGRYGWRKRQMSWQNSTGEEF